MFPLVAVARAAIQLLRVLARPPALPLSSPLISAVALGRFVTSLSIIAAIASVAALGCCVPSSDIVLVFGRPVPSFGIVCYRYFLSHLRRAPFFVLPLERMVLARGDCCSLPCFRTTHCRHDARVPCRVRSRSR